MLEKIEESRRFLLTVEDYFEHLDILIALVPSFDLRRLVVSQKIGKYMLEDNSYPLRIPLRNWQAKQIERLTPCPFPKND